MEYNIDKEYDFNVIGVDEAGRGPLAGPVSAAAVYIKNIKNFNYAFLINDSKKLSDKKRREIYEKLINDDNIIFSISIVDSDIIDKINILNATFLAMKNALLGLNLKLNKYNILVDGNIKIRDFEFDSKAIIKGDSKSLSIACASILAKVYRDKLMIEYSKSYPNYNFDKHKGYGTKLHYEAINKYGITKIHRKSFLKGVIKNEF